MANNIPNGPRKYNPTTVIDGKTACAVCLFESDETGVHLPGAKYLGTR